eukprot:PhF_6_TR25859/c0_g1_i1/m.36550
MAGKTWFSKAFGFLESDNYAENCAQFTFDESTFILTSLPNGHQFYVGPFETPSIAELRSRLASLPSTSPAEGAPSLGTLEFSEMVGDIRELHLRAKYNNAVVMVASQFNALEMVGPGVTPEKGITNYLKDQTQGPACALACPAATVFRNYKYNGVGQGGGEKHQIHNMKDVEQLLAPTKYWKTQNGYVLPLTATAMKELGHRMETEAGLSDKIVENIRVGLHWSTQVGTEELATQRVCQVFCSALPCSYCHLTKVLKDWTQFACAVLEASYDAVFAAAAIKSVQERTRITVLITKIGLGAFGNSAAWVRPAIDKACARYQQYPLDVFLVKFGSTTRK